MAARYSTHLRSAYRSIQKALKEAEIADQELYYAGYPERHPARELLGKLFVSLIKDLHAIQRGVNSGSRR